MGLLTSQSSGTREGGHGRARNLHGRVAAPDPKLKGERGDADVPFTDTGAGRATDYVKGKKKKYRNGEREVQRGPLAKAVDFLEGGRERERQNARLRALNNSNQRESKPLKARHNRR